MLKISGFWGETKEDLKGTTSFDVSNLSSLSFAAVMLREAEDVVVDDHSSPETSCNDQCPKAIIKS